MGNANSAIDQLKMESVSGKKLLAAIRVNSPAAVKDAIETARKEFTQPISRTTANASAYDDMLKQLIKYLTKEYDYGEGPLFLKTPLEYCQHLGSTKAADVIKEELEKLHEPVRQKARSDHVKSNVIGGISSDRAIEAKARLQAFREQGRKQEDKPKR